MPRYFFHTADGSCERDTEGTELANLDVARREAVRFAGEVLSHQPEFVLGGHDLRVEVTDQSDLVLFTVVVQAVNAPVSGKV